MLCLFGCPACTRIVSFADKPTEVFFQKSAQQAQPSLSKPRDVHIHVHTFLLNLNFPSLVILVYSLMPRASWSWESPKCQWFCKNSKLDKHVRKGAQCSEHVRSKSVAALADRFTPSFMAPHSWVTTLWQHTTWASRSRGCRCWEHQLHEPK